MLSEPPPSAPLYSGTPLNSAFSDDELATWYLQVESQWLSRNSPDRVVLSQRQDQTTLQSLQSISTNSFNYPMYAAFRIMLGRQLNATDSIEASYFGLTEWFQRRHMSITSSSPNAEQIMSPFLTCCLVTGTEDYTYDSQFHNAELNVRRVLVDNLDRRVSVLAGFRYVSNNEWFEVLDSNFTVLSGPTASLTGSEFQRAQVYNNLVGGQIGGDISEYLGPLALGVFARGGLFANLSKINVAHEQRLMGAINPASTAGTLTSSSTDLAGIFTAGLQGSFFITTGVFLRFGYDFHVIAGVAQAPNQLRPVTSTLDAAGNIVATNYVPGSFDHDGVLFLHGSSVGLEIAW